MTVYYFKISNDFKEELQKTIPVLFKPIYLPTISKKDYQKNFRALFYYVCFSFYHKVFENGFNSLTRKKLFNIFNIERINHNKHKTYYNEIVLKYQSVFPDFKIEKRNLENLSLFVITDKGISGGILKLIQNEVNNKNSKEIDICSFKQISIQQKQEMKKQTMEKVKETYADAEIVFYDSFKYQKLIGELIQNNGESFYHFNDREIFDIIEKKSINKDFDLHVQNWVRATDSYKPFLLPAVSLKKQNKNKEEQIIKDIDTFAYSTYHRSSRIYSVEISTLSFTREVRKELFKKYCNSDIKSSQLVLAAHYLNIEPIKTFLQTGKSIWVEFSDYLNIELTPDIKNKFKTGLYACLYGGGEKTIKTELGEYSTLSEHFVFKNLISEQKKWLSGNNGKFVKDLCFKYNYQIDSENYRSVLAILLQNVELYMLGKIAEYVKMDTGFTIIYTLHDSICFKGDDKEHEDLIRKQMDRIIKNIQMDIFGKDIGLKFEHELSS